MKFTLNWLKRHLETDASLEKICKTLTDIGLELEELEDRAAIFAPFKAAYVESTEKHPDADKLKICTVKTADHGEMKLVCGAPNARAGMMGVFAPEGSYIPGSDMVLKKGVIRGVESCGMLVSEREMGLSDEHEGIIELSDDIAVGTPLAQIFGLDDPIIEIALTPNRADCAGVRGIARDLAAAGLGTLKPLAYEVPKGSFESSVKVHIEDKDGCPQFLGRMIKGVKNGPSPEWMRNYLKSVGLRPISALVDITNFMTLDLCRPLHVYDADRLQGDIIVRAAKAGEGELEALNDKSYQMIDGPVAITDESGVIGLGGIVGGVSTGSEEGTENVFLEAAYFAPERIARAGRDLDVQSDARYRFERGVDPVFTQEGMEIATALILEICGGEASDVVVAGDTPEWEHQIPYDPAYHAQLIGFDVEAGRQKKILEDLGFKVEGAAPAFTVTPPSWRVDIQKGPQGRADLAEEVARIVGFDQIPATSVHADESVPPAGETERLSKARMARAAMASRGLNECVTWSFMKKDLADHFGANDNPARDLLTLSNPISAEMDQMRPSILPNLIEAAGRNADRGFGDVALCEVGPVFRSSKADGQDYIAAGLRSGHAGPRHWVDEDTRRAVDAFDVKADAIATLEACGAPGSSAQITRDAPAYYHPGRSGALRLGKNVLAYFGELHPAILDEMGIKSPMAGFEIFLENIPEARAGSTAKKLLQLPPLQALSKDFAFLVDESVAADDIIRAAKSGDKKLITDAYVFDVYQGQGVEDGKKSVALSITLQPFNETLTDEQIEEIMQNVINAVANKTGGVLRG